MQLIIRIISILQRERELNIILDEREINQELRGTAKFNQTLNFVFYCLVEDSHTKFPRLAYKNVDCARVFIMLLLLVLAVTRAE